MPNLNLINQQWPRYGRIPEACARYGWSRSRLYRLAGERKIVVLKVGRASFVDFDSADRFMASLPIAKIGKAA